MKEENKEEGLKYNWFSYDQTHPKYIRGKENPKLLEDWLKKFSYRPKGTFSTEDPVEKWELASETFGILTITPSGLKRVDENLRTKQEVEARLDEIIYGENVENLKYKWDGDFLKFQDNPELLKAWKMKYPKDNKTDGEFTLAGLHGNSWIWLRENPQTGEKTNAGAYYFENLNTKKKVEDKIDEILFNNQPVIEVSVTEELKPQELSKEWTLNNFCDTYTHKSGKQKLTNLDGAGWIGWDLNPKTGNWDKIGNIVKTPVEAVQELEDKTVKYCNESPDPYKQTPEPNLRVIQKFVCDMVGGEPGDLHDLSVHIDRSKFFERFSPDAFTSFLKETSEGAGDLSYSIVSWSDLVVFTFQGKKSL